VGLPRSQIVRAHIHGQSFHVLPVSPQLLFRPEIFVPPTVGAVAFAETGAELEMPLVGALETEILVMQEQNLLACRRDDVPGRRRRVSA
jgi:hypothetical protein